MKFASGHFGPLDLLEEYVHITTLGLKYGPDVLPIMFDKYQP